MKTNLKLMTAAALLALSGAGFAQVPPVIDPTSPSSSFSGSYVYPAGMPNLTFQLAFTMASRGDISGTVTLSDPSLLLPGAFVQVNLVGGSAGSQQTQPLTGTAPTFSFSNLAAGSWFFRIFTPNPTGTPFSVNYLVRGGNSAAPVPEADTAAMLLLGLGAVGWAVSRRMRRI